MPDLCNNPRTTSWAVAILYLILMPILAGIFIMLLCFSEQERREMFDDYADMRITYLIRIWVGVIYCILTFAATIALIIGIKQKRYKLLNPFLHLVSQGATFWLILAAFQIYRGVKAEKPFLDIALEVVALILLFGFQWLCYVPVRKLKKLMKYEPCPTSAETMTPLRDNK